jgi:aryl-alcohol dehydrogenase-like predicted oxidoreductase
MSPRKELAMAGSGIRFAPRRELGRTGFVATVLGIGDLADRSVPIEACVATVHRAMDAGLNVIDTAPGYEGGYSEEIVGRALRGHRAGMFVIDKIDHPDRPVEAQAAESLKRMGLDGVDLFLFHGVSTLEVWETLLRGGGGFDQLDACRRRGMCRFVGISSHSPEVLRGAVDSGRTDVLMFAVGAHADARYTGEILPLTRERGIGTVCFKSFGAGKLLCDTEGYSRPLSRRPRGKVSSGGVDVAGSVLPRLSVEECVRYTLSCDPDVALLGLSFPNEQDAAFSAASGFRPYAPHEMEELRARALDAVRNKGPCWWNPPPNEVV